MTSRTADDTRQLLNWSQKFAEYINHVHKACGLVAQCSVRETDTVAPSVEGNIY